MSCQRPFAVLLASCLVSFAPAACGDDESSEGTSLADTETTPTISASTSATALTGSDSGPTDGSEGASDDTADGLCPDDASPEGPDVAFTITNTFSEAVFVALPFFCAEAHVRIDSESDPGGWPIDACTARCVDIVNDACECPDTCDRPGLLRIGPGASFDVTWDGTWFAGHELEENCIVCDVAPDCKLRVLADAGTYLGTAAGAMSASDCMPADCGCPNGEDACFIEGTSADPFEFGAQALFDYPDQTAVELVFEPA